MSDTFTTGIRPGSTDVTIYVFLESAAHVEQTGKVAANVTASYWRQGEARTAIAVTDLAAITDAHTDGGWKEVDAANVPGLYRFDLPDAAVAAGADWTIVAVKVTGCRLFWLFVPLGDLFETAVPGGYTSGTAGGALGRIGSSVIETRNPVAEDGSITLVKGDDYLATDNRALEWSDAQGVWPDLTGAALTLTAVSRDTGATWTVASVSSPTPTGDTKVVRAEPTRTETALLEEGEQIYDFQIEATLASGSVATLVSSYINVTGDVA